MKRKLFFICVISLLGLIFPFVVILIENVTPISDSQEIHEEKLLLTVLGKNSFSTNQLNFDLES